MLPLPHSYVQVHPTPDPSLSQRPAARNPLNVPRCQPFSPVDPTRKLDFDKSTSLFELQKALFPEISLPQLVNDARLRYLSQTSTESSSSSAGLKVTALSDQNSATSVTLDKFDDTPSTSYDPTPVTQHLELPKSRDIAASASPFGLEEKGKGKGRTVDSGMASFDQRMERLRTRALQFEQTMSTFQLFREGAHQPEPLGPRPLQPIVSGSGSSHSMNRIATVSPRRLDGSNGSMEKTKRPVFTVDTSLHEQSPDVLHSDWRRVQGSASSLRRSSHVRAHDRAALNSHRPRQEENELSDPTKHRVSETSAVPTSLPPKISIQSRSPLSTILREEPSDVLHHASRSIDARADELTLLPIQQPPPSKSDAEIWRRLGERRVRAHMPSNDPLPIAPATSGPNERASSNSRPIERASHRQIHLEEAWRTWGTAERMDDDSRAPRPGFFGSLKPRYRDATSNHSLRPSIASLDITRLRQKLSRSRLHSDPHSHSHSRSETVNNLNPPKTAPSSRSAIARNEHDPLGLTFDFGGPFMHEVIPNLSASNEDALTSASEQLPSECGICTSEVEPHERAVIPGCQDVFCLDCIRHYVIGRLEDGHLDMPCPTCVAKRVHANGRRAQVAINMVDGEVSRDIVEFLGLNKVERDMLERLELAKFAVLHRCPM